MQTLRHRKLKILEAIAKQYLFELSQALMYTKLQIHSPNQSESIALKVRESDLQLRYDALEYELKSIGINFE